MFSIGCSENISENENPSTTNTNNNPEPSPTTINLPTKIIYTTSSNISSPFISIISYDGNKIIDIRKQFTNEVLYEFTYDAERITKIKSNQYDGFSTPQYYNFTYENGRLKNITKQTPNSSDQASYTNYNVTLDWISNTNVKFKVPFTSNAIGNSYVYYELFFDDNENLIKSTTDQKILSRYFTTETYTYDDQITTPFKNVAGINKFNGIINLFLGIAKYQYSHIFPSEFFLSKNNLTKINSNTKIYDIYGNFSSSYDLEYNYFYEPNTNNYTKIFKTTGIASNITTTIEYIYD